jgi:hypothetical protein
MMAEKRRNWAFMIFRNPESGEPAVGRKLSAGDIKPENTCAFSTANPAPRDQRRLTGLPGAIARRGRAISKKE